MLLTRVVQHCANPLATLRPDLECSVRALRTIADLVAEVALRGP